MMEEYGLEVLAKKPRSLSSPKDEKFEFAVVIVVVNIVIIVSILVIENYGLDVLAKTQVSFRSRS